METYELKQYRPRCCTIHAALFRSVSNTIELLSQLKSKGPEAFPLQIALIDAAYIVSREHILVAVHQSMLGYSRDLANREKTGDEGEGDPIRGMKTKSIHSEILWNLSISSNIMDSFRTFGVSEKTTDIIAIHVADEDADDARTILTHMSNIIKGDLQRNGLEALSEWKKDTPASDADSDGSPADWDRVRKVYKLSGIEDKYRVESLVTSMVAMKNVAA